MTQTVPHPPDQKVPPSRTRHPGSATVTHAIAHYGILIATLMLFIALSLANSRFLTQRNLLNIVDQQAALGIIACAVTLTVIAGGFDLSVAAVYALSGVIAAKTAIAWGPLPGLIMAILSGLAIGAVNGLLVTVGRIQSFIATLATSIVVRGIALVVTGGFVLTVSDEAFGKLGTERFAQLRYPGWILLAFMVVTWIILHHSTFGRYIFAVGGNPEAARLSGIRVNLVRFSTFVIAGGAAGLAGMIDVSRVSSAQAGIGVGMELTAIAAIVIGGTSILGGEGAIWRTVCGVTFLALVSNGFNILGINPVYQQIFQGLLILAAISMAAWAHRQSR
ncbi:ABC transporter permease [Williamsia sp.]|uniref:ABC transporter permease n=1 Tax=Williamsia sp. TaxID=1872085 RepID=UPI002F958D50